MSALPYREIHTHTAQDFLSELNPLKSNLSTSSNKIYRGQENSDWPLRASLFRKLITESKILNPRELSIIEMTILLLFSKTLGNINLSDQRCKIISEYLNMELSHAKQTHLFQDWPTSDALELMALAQHSGIPTRLLDWTYNPFIAAHFAAYSAITHKTKAENLAVWCYDRSYTTNTRTGIQVGEFVSNVYNLEPPFWGSNPNAAAQSGCFLYLKNIHDSSHIDIEDQLIINKSTDENHFIKITAPVSEALKILRYCELLGISRSKLFRTYEGCAEEINLNIGNILSDFGYK